MSHADARASYVRISPSKVKIVLDLVRGKGVDEAIAILKFTPKRAAKVVEKVIRSAVANAENNFDLDRGALYVARADVGSAPTMKRWHPRQRGRAFPILKRSSHIMIRVQERETSAKAK